MSVVGLFKKRFLVDLMIDGRRKRRKEEKRRRGKRRIRRGGGEGAEQVTRCLVVTRKREGEKSWMSFRVQHKPKIVEASTKCTEKYLESTRGYFWPKGSLVQVPAGTGSTLFRGHGTLNEGKLCDSILYALSEFEPHDISV